MFESDEELDEFLADLREARRADELLMLARVAEELECHGIWSHDL